MDSSNQPKKTSCADFHSAVSSPVTRLIQVTDQGMVFESKESFEIGSGIELGFHVQYHVGGKNSPQDRSLRSEFITCEGIIVGSLLCAASDGSPVYEVTLLFSSMSGRDRRALRRFTKMEGRLHDQLEEEMAALECDGLGLN